ncbi:DUF3330 domain-containing protein [Ferrigenium sp. UT5]|uniref:DUF3330 domain-containing protein n=1 Tax=Ferrigenium sp. UT5 TaxID=3242105 RepID=UPI0035525DFE
MTTKPAPATQTIACEICLKEVPLSEAKTFEAEDYVAHFCGLECYAQWKQRSEKSEPPKKTT